MAADYRQKARRAIEKAKQAVTRTLQKEYRKFEARMVKSHLSGPTGPQSVSRRTGALSKSIRLVGPSMTGNQARVGARFGVGSETVKKYAKTHEFGATIRKKSKYLTIPLGPAKTGAGVTRQSARSYGDLRCIKSKRGNLLLVKVVKGKVVPYFVLKESVHIPARTHFRVEWKRAVADMKRSLSDLLRQQTKGMGAGKRRSRGA